LIESRVKRRNLVAYCIFKRYGAVNTPVHNRYADVWAVLPVVQRRDGRVRRSLKEVAPVFEMRALYLMTLGPSVWAVWNGKWKMENGKWFYYYAL
jgi:hypothetical protein